jgi:hypothetical protein
LQFLRRSLLAGAQKFKPRFTQTLPMSMLEIFRSRLHYVTKLYIVGYSFGDSHIDATLRDWLEFAAIRSLVSVDPRRTDMPPQLAHLAVQITLCSKTAGDFFAEYRDRPMSASELLLQKGRANSRAAFEKQAARKW